MTVTLKNLTKIYNKRIIFKDISWYIKQNECAVIAGANGSGKSTLLKIIAGLIRPQRGQVIWNFNDKTMSLRENKNQLGYVAPDLQLYHELTALENLRFIAEIRGVRTDDSALISHLEDFQLSKAINWQVGTFSSGMKQRLKLAYALLHGPKLLLLDEPATNLDNVGKNLLAAIIKKQLQQGLVILATNEEQEVSAYGENLLYLGD